MNNNSSMYPYTHYADTSSYADRSIYDSDNIYNEPCPCLGYDRYIPFDDGMEHNSRLDFSDLEMDDEEIVLKDYGPDPFVVNIDEATKQNNNYRTGLWTGKHLQVTLMSIDVGDDIGLEVHPDTDQFLRIEEGKGIVKMGKDKNNLDFQENAYDDFAIMVPAGFWHNIVNTGNKPLKVYAIYAPPEHPQGVVNEMKPTEAEEVARKNLL